MTAFDKWLTACKVAGKGGVADEFFCTRGEAWAQDLPLDGDWTGATMTGYLKQRPDAATTLVALTCTAGDVVTEGDVTTSWFTLSLSAGETTALTADTTGEGVVELAAFVFLEPSGGSKELLLGGVLTVLGD